MGCPNAVRTGTHLCTEPAGGYMPSAFQLREYCRSRNYIKCPFFPGYHSIRAGITAPQAGGLRC